MKKFLRIWFVALFIVVLFSYYVNNKNTTNPLVGTWERAEKKFYGNDKPTILTYTFTTDNRVVIEMTEDGKISEKLIGTYTYDIDNKTALLVFAPLNTSTGKDSTIIRAVRYIDKRIIHAYQNADVESPDYGVYINYG